MHRRVLVVDDLEGPETPVEDVLVDAPLEEVREEAHRGDHHEVGEVDRGEARELPRAHEEGHEADAGGGGEVPVRAVPPRDLGERGLANDVTPGVGELALGRVPHEGALARASVRDLVSREVVAAEARPAVRGVRRGLDVELWRGGRRVFGEDAALVGDRAVGLALRFRGGDPSCHATASL